MLTNQPTVEQVKAALKATKERILVLGKKQAAMDDIRNAIPEDAILRLHDDTEIALSPISDLVAALWEEADNERKALVDQADSLTAMLSGNIILAKPKLTL